MKNCFVFLILIVLKLIFAQDATIAETKYKTINISDTVVKKNIT